VVLGLAAALVAGGAAVPGSQRSAVTADQQASFTPTRNTGIPGALTPEELKLWLYDAESGTFQEVEGDASQPYEPNLRNLPEGTKVGFAEGWAAIPFSAAINRRLYELAEAHGFDVIYCDIEFDSEKSVTCAEQIVAQAPNVAINSSWAAGAAPSVAAVYDSVKVPTMSIDMPHPNEIFVGADNYTSGFIGGQAAGQRAQAEDHCGDAWIFLGESPPEGPAPNERLVGFADGVQTICGAIPAERRGSALIDAGTTDQALTATTDWLTAHPEATYILSTTIDDARSDGVAKAITQSNREGFAVGLGCDDIGIAATKASASDNNHFLGCVAYFPEKYSDYLVSIAADILEGKPVPQEVHLAHEFLDATSIGDVYP
jgi:ribose transport system substrate-binding protein